LIRPDAKGRIKKSEDLGRSLTADRRRKAKKVRSGYGDKRDRLIMPHQGSAF
jgi:hypothetical protein